MPKIVQSDQGREFLNSVNDHLFKATGIKHIVSLAYHPQTNGLVERFNQTVQRSLLKMVQESEKKWENYLESVLFAYRTSKQASTKYSPFFLLYGREPRLPVDSMIGDNTVSEIIITCTCMHSYVHMTLKDHDEKEVMLDGGEMNDEVCNYIGVSL